MSISTSSLRLPVALALILSFATVACDDDQDPAVSHSGDIALNLNMGPSDITLQNILVDGKNITAEQGNPCGKFIQDAEAVLGRPPSALRVNFVQLNFNPQQPPQGVATLDDLWNGMVTVSFVIDPTNRIEVAAGLTDGTTDTFAVPLTVDQALLDANMTGLNACGYSVEVSGDAEAGLQQISFDALVTVTVNLSALP